MSKLHVKTGDTVVLLTGDYKDKYEDGGKRKTGKVLEVSPKEGKVIVEGINKMCIRDRYALVRLPSGELRNVPINCKATIGQVSNIDHENVNLGKAGRTRHKGIRPTVRGSVMNPCDHQMCIRDRPLCTRRYLTLFGSSITGYLLHF